MAAVLQADEPNDARGNHIADPVLRLSLFGPMRAEDAWGRSVLPRSRKTRALLAVLALAAPKPVLRSQLTALLWSRRAKEQARGSLRQSVFELQRTLGQAASLVRTDRNHLVLSDQGLWVDLRVAAGSVAGALGPAGVRTALLDGLDGLDPAFDGWLADQRERVAQQALATAVAVLDAAPDSTARIAAAECLLGIDRLYEPAWRALISAHLERDDRAAARSAFERCAEALSRAGLPPLSETEALIRRAQPGQHARAAIGMKRNGSGADVRLSVLQPRVPDEVGSAGLMPGLAEEITAAVSRFRWISCVAEAPGRRSTGLPGFDSDADYLLDSMLQRAGDRTRIIIRLFDLHAGSDVIWARRFDRNASDDPLTLQADIASETAAQVDLELLLREGERRRTGETAGLTAMDRTLRAVPAIYRLEPLGFHAAGELLDEAVTLEPDNATSNAWWAYWHLFLVGQAWAPDPVAAAQRAGELAERAVTLDPRDARALALVGHVRGFLHKRAAEASALLERALSLNPNLALAWCFSGLAHCYLSHHELAIEHILRARHLSPQDPHAFFFDTALMMPYFLQNRLDEALALGRRSVELNPRFTATYKGYLATLGQLRHHREAERVLTRLLALEPGFSISNAIERSPMQSKADLDFYAEGLRRAGLPES